MSDERDVVRHGYDVVSRRYRGDEDEPPHYAGWIAELTERLPARGRVLDLGCGCGVPILRDLAAAGHEVTGVDLSPVQIERARALVPDADLRVADLTEVSFDDAAFDAVVSLYAIIHVPVAEHEPLLRRIARWLRPGGWLLLISGDTAWTGTEEDWLGGGASMWWSHPDRATTRGWLEGAGFTVTEVRHIPEGDLGHALFWAQVG